MDKEEAEKTKSRKENVIFFFPLFVPKSLLALNKIPQRQSN